jgi:ribonuclease P protein component
VRQTYLKKLRTAAEYQKVYRAGRKYSDPYFQLFVCPGESSESRYGITATRRLGSAVTRNRVKRVLRESMRKISPLIPEGYDIVILSRDGMIAEKEPVVRDRLLKLLKKAFEHFSHLRRLNGAET